MSRRVLITFDETPTAVVDDVPTALVRATAIVRERLEAAYLKEGKDSLPEEMLQALDGEGEDFEMLAAAGVPATPAFRLATVARESLYSLAISTHEIHDETKVSAQVNKFEVLGPREPSMALFQAILSIYADSRSEPRVTSGVLAKIESQTRFEGGEGTSRNARSTLKRLRRVQDLFGPPEGHPFRIVPDEKPGENPVEVLASIKDVASERLQTAIDNIPWKSPTP